MFRFPVPSPDQLRLLTCAAATAPDVPITRWAKTLWADRAAPRGDSGLTLDISLAVRGDGHDVCRFSVNDRGAPHAFRDAVRSVASRWGSPSTDLLDRFFAIAAPGLVQTTVGVKAVTGRPTRISLYYEELSMAPDQGRRITEQLAGLAGVPTPEGQPPLAAAIDVQVGSPLSFKWYLSVIDRPRQAGSPPLPGSLEAFRSRLPFRRGRRTLLVARRSAAEGPVGRKLLWVPEVRQSGDVSATWTTVLALTEALKLPASRSAGALLRASQDDAFYPDLVSLDTDDAGVPSGLTVYVAVRPDAGKKRRAKSM